jgi:hypothetical protein
MSVDTLLISYNICHKTETKMEAILNHQLYPANWGVRYLCDCKKLNQEINIHKGIAQEISTQRVRILSDHHICQQKKIAMQLIIPSPLNGAPKNIIKIIGKTIVTIMKEGKFLTEIEFQHFEENGQKELEKNLLQRFNQRFSEKTALRA